MMKKDEFLQKLAQYRNEAHEDMLTANRHGWLQAWSEASGRKRAIEIIFEWAKFLDEPSTTPTNKTTTTQPSRKD